jgi:hypothetical protein
MEGRSAGDVIKLVQGNTHVRSRKKITGQSPVIFCLLSSA